MRFKAKIEIEDKGPLYKCLVPELQDAENKRSKVDIKKTSEGVDVRVKAMDVVALKARVNSVIKLVEVYEKVKNG
tara:strand:+ start:342 stop:566 length:225 start_codon:yes stop_codon:yes gene_type:complete